MVRDISPNPAVDEITIDLAINSKTHCQLRIYAADGKLVNTLLDEPLANDKKQFKVSLAGVSPQTLYLTLKTNEGLVCRTILKQ